jgi:glyoxylase-like metal-dependent hydrolase (beta-lactamase superfamily II)
MHLTNGVYFYSSPGGLDFTGEICSNTIVLQGQKLVLIDPGTLKRLPDLLDAMVAEGLNPADIKTVLLTHSHPDHREAAPELAERFGARVFLPSLEREFLRKTGEVFFAKYAYPKPEFSFDLCEEGLFTAWGLELRLILTPGHTPGGISIFWPEGKLLVTGDLFFPGTIGAFNLFGGNPGEMYKSVASLRDMGGVEKILCGHGPAIIARDMVIQNYRALFAEISAKKAAGFV